MPAVHGRKPKGPLRAASRRPSGALCSPASRRRALLCLRVDPVGFFHHTQAAQLLVKAGQFLGHTVKYVSVRILPGRCSISAMGIIPQLCKRKELPIAWKLRDMEVQKKTMLLPLLTMQGEIGTC